MALKKLPAQGRNPGGVRVLADDFSCSCFVYSSISHVVRLRIVLPETFPLNPDFPEYIAVGFLNLKSVSNIRNFGCIFKRTNWHMNFPEAYRTLQVKVLEVSWTKEFSTKNGSTVREFSVTAEFSPHMGLTKRLIKFLICPYFQCTSCS